MAKAADRSRWDFIGELALAATTWGGPEEGPLAVKQYGDEKSIQSIQSLSRRSGTTGGSSRTDSQERRRVTRPEGRNADGEQPRTQAVCVRSDGEEEKSEEEPPDDPSRSLRAMQPPMREGRPQRGGEAPEKTPFESDRRSDPSEFLAKVGRRGPVQKEKKSTTSGSQSAARSQSPTVMKIDGPEPGRPSVDAREPRAVIDPKGDQRYRGEPSEDYVEFPRTLRVMPWDRKEWPTSSIRPPCPHCGERKDLVHCAPGEELLPITRTSG